MTRNLNWLIVLLLIGGLISITSCSDDDEEELVGNWVSIGDFDGTSRADAVAFTIGDFAYIGTGYNGTEDERYRDFWRFNPNTKIWSKIADFPGIARNGAVAFEANGKGYVGTGYDGNNKLNDFYEYNPETNTWRRIADFPEAGRYGAVAFSINNYGYVGTGYDGNNLKDFYKYDPQTDSWTSIGGIGGGTKRRDAVAFVIDGKAYIVTGVNNSIYLADFYMYDPATDTWTEKRKIADVTDSNYDDDYNIVCANSVAFVMGGKGYISTGGTGSAGYLTWEYNPTTDVWLQKTDFEGSPRLDAVSFTVNNRGYVAAGRSSGYYYDDVWSFYPNDEQNDED